jgi:hypothetical protein
VKSPALRYPETGLEEINGDVLEADLNEAAGAANAARVQITGSSRNSSQYNNFSPKSIQIP